MCFLSNWHQQDSNSRSFVLLVQVAYSNIFSALWTSLWSKNKGGGRAPWAPPRDRPLLCIILVPKLWSVVWSSSRLQKKGYSKSNRAITNGYRYSWKPGNIRSSFWEPPPCLYQGFRKSVTVMAIDCGNILPLEMFLLLVHEHLFTI